MRRRTFLASLLGLLGLGAAPPPKDDRGFFICRYDPADDFPELRRKRPLRWAALPNNTPIGESVMRLAVPPSGHGLMIVGKDNIYLME